MQITDEFTAALNVEGAIVRISAPTFDVLSTLIAKFKGLPSAPAKSTVQLVKETKAPAGVSADEKAALLGNAQSQPAANQSADPAATPSAATEQAAASDVTQDMVNKATIALSKIDGGTDKAKAIFTELGVGRASEITAKCPERMAEAHAKLTAALGA